MIDQIKKGLVYHPYVLPFPPVHWPRPVTLNHYHPTQWRNSFVNWWWHSVGPPEGDPGTPWWITVPPKDSHFGDPYYSVMYVFSKRHLTGSWSHLEVVVLYLETTQYSDSKVSINSGVVLNHKGLTMFDLSTFLLLSSVVYFSRFVTLTININYSRMTVYNS